MQRKSLLPALGVPRAEVLRYWLQAVRPKTLSIAVVPVLTGSALAWAEAGELNWLILGVTVVVAVLIQMGTNLHNDAADFERGADQSGTRLGPPRATAEGWLSAGQVRRGASLCFVLAFLLGIYLVWAGGWPILVLGIASIIAGIAYTGGPFPIAYSALGELFVCLFFGVAAVTGSYFLQVGQVSPAALLVGLMLGMLAAAVLVVNNYRDLDNDRKVGKNTLAVRLGRPATQVEYLLLLVLPFGLLPGLYLAGTGVLGSVLPLLVAPRAITLVRRFRRETPGPAFNELLAATAQLQLCFAVLLCLGLSLSGR